MCGNIAVSRLFNLAASDLNMSVKMSRYVRCENGEGGGMGHALLGHEARRLP